MIESPPARLYLGMVGGGHGAFIGEAHWVAALLDDRYELVAGALSADHHRAMESGCERLHYQTGRPPQTETQGSKSHRGLQ